MPEENNYNQPIPLSQGKRIRRISEHNNSDKFEISEARLRTIMSEVVSKEVSSKIARLENSIDRLANQFEGYKNGNPEDAALRVTTDSQASDLALASADVPKEELYPYTCGILAAKLKLRQHDVVQMIRKFDLRNNEKYHHVFKTGIKSEVQKWSEAAYQRLKQALDSGEYSRPISE